MHDDLGSRVPFSNLLKVSPYFKARKEPTLIRKQKVKLKLFTLPVLKIQAGGGTEEEGDCWVTDQTAMAGHCRLWISHTGLLAPV